MSLHPDFVEACKIHLPELLRIWLSVEPIDRRPVVEPIAQNGSRVRIERYRGDCSSGKFGEDIEQSYAFKKLSKAISEYQPELTQNLIIEGRIYFSSEPSALAGSWCIFLQENGADRSNPVDQCVNELLVLLERTLEARTLTEVTRTALVGVYLPPSRSSIELSPNAGLRHISKQEQYDFESEEDVSFFMGGNSYAPSLVATCLELSRICCFSLNAAEIKSSSPQVVNSKEVSATSVLRALHVLKYLVASSRFESIEWRPKILASYRRFRAWPRPTSIDVRGVLNEHEVDSFIAIEKGLRESPREELRIAADRLVEAVHRSSRVDAIVDAVIGLEILLKPADADELNFRVALNYAFLGPPECRRQRFKKVREIQRHRNKIVHGSAQYRGPDAEGLLGKAADAAMSALRDVLQRFIADPSLQGNKPLDAEFWLNRLFDQ